MNQLLLLAFLALTGSITLGNSVKVIRQGDAALVEMLGKYEGKKLEPGLTFLVPFLEQVAYQQTLREQILEMPPKQCTTSDRITITADFVVYWRLTDIEKAYYKVQNLKGAMTNLLETQMRTEIARLELDELFTARAEINERLVEELDIATEPWGIKITRVELRDFTIGNRLAYTTIQPSQNGLTVTQSNESSKLSQKHSSIR